MRNLLICIILAYVCCTSCSTRLQQPNRASKIYRDKIYSQDIRNFEEYNNYPSDNRDIYEKEMFGVNDLVTHYTSTFPLKIGVSFSSGMYNN